VTDVEEYKLSLYETIETIKESNEAKVELVRNSLEDKKYIKISYHSDKRDIFLKLMTIESDCLPKIIELFWCEDTIVIEEYIEGALLSDLLEKGNINKRNNAALIKDILNAVDELHKLGIVHRDIKPSNVVVKNNGQAVLVDFGIAKLYFPNLKNDSSSYGTIGYAPPEQYGFSQSDFKSDIYAIGITIKEIAQVTDDKSLNVLIQKCTEFDPNKRPESIERVRRLIDINKIQAIATAIVLVCVCGCIAFGFVHYEKNNKLEGNNSINTEDNIELCELMDIDASISDYRCLRVTESGIDEMVLLGDGLEKTIIKANLEDNMLVLQIGDNFKETLEYDISVSSKDYDNTSFHSEIVLYDLNYDGIDEIIPVIADAFITDEQNPTVLRNGMTAWCIGFDNDFYLADGEMTTVYDVLTINGTTPDYIWGEFPKCYKLEERKIIEYE